MASNRTYIYNTYSPEKGTEKKKNHLQKPYDQVLLIDMHEFTITTISITYNLQSPYLTVNPLKT
jgi:hypothetical protein